MLMAVLQIKEGDCGQGYFGNGRNWINSSGLALLD